MGELAELLVLGSRLFSNLMWGWRCKEPSSGGARSLPLALDNLHRDLLSVPIPCRRWGAKAACCRVLQLA